MQVKYEVVRAVTVGGAAVTATAAAFGYSRPSYYQAAAALAASGLEGLGHLGSPDFDDCPEFCERVAHVTDGVPVRRLAAARRSEAEPRWPIAPIFRVASPEVGCARVPLDHGSKGGYLAREEDRRWLTQKGCEWADSHSNQAG